jgi:hypothetical protein
MNIRRQIFLMPIIGVLSFGVATCNQGKMQEGQPVVMLKVHLLKPSGDLFIEKLKVYSKNNEFSLTTNQIYGIASRRKVFLLKRKDMSIVVQNPFSSDDYSIDFHKTVKHAASDVTVMRAADDLATLLRQPQMTVTVKIPGHAPVP